MREGWVQIPIGDIAQVLSGFAFKSELFNETEGMPLIRIRDLPKGNKTEALYAGNYEDRYVVRKGDFLIGMDGEFQCYEWSGPDALLNQRVCRIQDFKRDLVEPRFIFFSVNQFLDKIEQNTGFTTVKHISSKQITAIKIPLPPLPEQKRIVDLISSVDSFIDALEQQAESARKSRSAVLHELLSAGGDGWIETTLGQLISLEYGKSLTESNRDGIGYPVYGSAGVVGMHSKPLVSDSPVIIVGRKGTAGAVYWSDSPCFIIDTAYFVSIKSDIVPRFLFHLLNSINLESVTAQTGVPGLNRDRAYSLKCLIPPQSEQKRIVDLVSSIDDGISATEKLINETKQLRSGLLSDLLSGDHEIPESYDKVMGAA